MAADEAGLNRRFQGPAAAPAEAEWTSEKGCGVILWSVCRRGLRACAGEGMQGPRQNRGHRLLVPPWRSSLRAPFASCLRPRWRTPFIDSCANCEGLRQCQRRVEGLQTRSRDGAGVLITLLVSQRWHSGFGRSDATWEMCCGIKHLRGCGNTGGKPRRHKCRAR
jgi:hypothetical protein